VLEGSSLYSKLCMYSALGLFGGDTEDSVVIYVNAFSVRYFFI